MSKKKLPGKLLELCGYYSGDESWREFADCFDVNEENVDKIANKYHINKATAKVIEWHIQEKYADQWFNKKIPALYDYRPIDLINDYENGETCLRVILRRMH